jgi:hypothetical protein
MVKGTKITNEEFQPMKITTENKVADRETPGH